MRDAGKLPSSFKRFQPNYPGERLQCQRDSSKFKVRLTNGFGASAIASVGRVTHAI